MRKRFIAGAICPECKEIDKLVVYKQDDKDFRECVACGFKDEMHFKAVAREPITRVNQTQDQINAETQVIKFPPEE